MRRLPPSGFACCVLIGQTERLRPAVLMLGGAVQCIFHQADFRVSLQLLSSRHPLFLQGAVLTLNTRVDKLFEWWALKLDLCGAVVKSRWTECFRGPPHRRKKIDHGISGKHALACKLKMNKSKVTTKYMSLKPYSIYIVM